MPCRSPKCLGFPCRYAITRWLSGKESACDVGAGLIPVWGRSPGEGNGNPLQYSCLENPMDRWAWRATVRGVATELNLMTKQPATPSLWGCFLLCKSGLCSQLHSCWFLYCSEIPGWDGEWSWNSTLFHLCSPSPHRSNPSSPTVSLSRGCIHGGCGPVFPLIHPALAAQSWLTLQPHGL